MELVPTGTNGQQEKWQQQTATTTYAGNKYQYQLTDNTGSGFLMQPGNGQFWRWRPGR